MRLAMEFEGISSQMRARRAEVLFAQSRIKGFIKERAENGHRHVRIYQSLPYELSKTPAAIALLQWLKAEGFSWVWQPAFKVADESRPGTSIAYIELEINW